MGGNKRIKTLAIVAALLFVGGLAYLYMNIKEAGDFWPYENEPGTLTNDVNQLESEVQRLRVEVAKIPATMERLEAVKVEYDLATRVLPRENSPDQLIAAIRTKAQQSGVTPDRLVPSVNRGAAQNRRGQANFEEWSFTLDIRGSYDQIGTFVNRMEEFESTDAAKTGSEKRFFQVQNIEITSEENGMANLGASAGAEGKRGHQCVLIMQTYRYTGTE